MLANMMSKNELKANHNSTVDKLETIAVGKYDLKERFPQAISKTGAPCILAKASIHHPRLIPACQPACELN